MNRGILRWLACPRCGSALELRTGETDEEEVLHGELGCSCGSRFPVRDGVPRLFAEAAAGGVDGDRRSRRSFGYQWRRYQSGDRTWFKDDAGLRRGELLQTMDARPGELAGLALLDAGCGNGELTRAAAAECGEVVGLDFSDSVVAARRRLLDASPELAPRVHHLQADVRRPPLRERSRMSSAAGFTHRVHSPGAAACSSSTMLTIRSMPFSRNSISRESTLLCRRKWRYCSRLSWSMPPPACRCD